MKTVSFILLFFFVASCTSNKKHPTIVESEDTTVVSQIPVIDIQKDYPKKKIILEDIADIEYIPLETTDSVLLSLNTRMAFSDELIAIADVNQETVFFFDRKGKLINSFNHKGAGNKEYTTMFSCCFDFDQKEVFVWDYQLLYRIMVYSFKGEFKRELKINKTKWPNGYFYSYDKKHLISYDTYYKYYEDSTSIYPYFLIDKQDGSITFLPLKVDNRITNSKSWSDGNAGHSVQVHIENWMKADDGIYVSDFALDTIYHCVGDQLFPKAIRQNNPNKVEWLSSLCLETNDYSFFKVLNWEIDDVAEDGETKLERILVYDKRNSTFYNTFVTLADFSERKRVQIENISRNDIPEGYYVDLFTVDMLKFFLDKKALKGKIKEIAENLDEDANPVLVIAKFKK